jgi:hypothetical protein
MYMLCYSDDILIASKKPKAIIDLLEAMHVLNAGSVSELKLGAKIAKNTLENAQNLGKTGGQCWLKTM